MNGSCLGESANPSPRRAHSLVEQGSLAAAVSFSRLWRYCLARLDGAQSRRSFTWGKYVRLMVAAHGCPLGTAAPLADGRGSALACRIRCINKLVCRKARCRRPTLRRVRRMRKRRMHFGGKRKTSYSLLAWTCAEPRSCGFFKSALARRPRPRWRWRGDLARSGATRYNGRFPKSVGCSDACEARFADGRSVRSSA